MSPSVPVGAVIAGKYRVEKVLGAGAMGVVVAARHLDLLELRAIKLMMPAGRQSAEGVERFLREARAAARLRSQHVAKVHDVGRLDDGAPYAVIEYLEGSDLKAVLDARGVLPPAEVITYLLQVCEAIGEAHAAGIVHRDLKPANLFLTRSPSGAPCVKVLDFGIAKMATDAGAPVEMTATSQMLGTPLYMSPEQMRGARDVDGRADIWALGVILYRMLTGQMPFSGTSITEICSAVIADNPPAPRSLRPDLPVELEQIVLRCLQKAPAQRFASVAELSAALEHARSAVSTGAPIPSPAAVGGASMAYGPTMVGAGTTVPQAAHPAYPPQGASMGQATHPYSQAGNPYPTGPAAASMGSPGAPYSAATAGPMQGQAGWTGAAPWPGQAGQAATAPGGSRVGLWIGLGAALAIGATAGALLLLRNTEDETPSHAGSQGPGAVVSAPGSPPASGGAAAPGVSAGAGPGARSGTQGSGKGTGTAAAQGSSSATTQPSSQPAGASAKNVGLLQGVLLSCWKNNEGANKGEPASSASAQVTLGGSRSVVVSGPAKAKPGFTGCVVTRASSTAFDPGDSVVAASAGLPAGPS